ncbi:hypothetical protein [Legionella tunisiensis]|uniref:hypothetical protein n=1 Tax=Legionella tunisiensis TaxID=1034944 RepID=UPI0003094863|nr:hypothetical protein [Legionella tunisiensis]
MLVHRIREFINALESIKDKLSEDDLALLNDFQEKYSAKVKPLEEVSGELLSPPAPSNVDPLEEYTGDLPPLLDPDSLLSEEDFAWIQARFAKRWKNIADTENDYTFYPGGSEHGLGFIG